MTRLFPLVLLPLALVVGACGTEDPEDEVPDDHGGEATDPGTTTVIDASSDTEWVYFDLDTLTEVTEADGWDLGFQRETLIVNGGVNGDGGVEVSFYEGYAYTFGEWGDQVPPHGWTTDANVALAFGLWLNTEADPVEAGDTLFFVMTTEERGVELRFLSYDDGVVTIESGVRVEP